MSLFFFSHSYAGKTCYSRSKTAATPAPPGLQRAAPQHRAAPRRQPLAHTNPRPNPNQNPPLFSRRGEEQIAPLQSTSAEAPLRADTGGFKPRGNTTMKVHIWSCRLQVIFHAPYPAWQLKSIWENNYYNFYPFQKALMCTGGFFTILPVKYTSSQQKQSMRGKGLSWKLLLTIFSYCFRGTKCLWNCNLESRTFKTCNFLTNICKHQCIQPVKRWCWMERQILKANWPVSITISQGGGEKKETKNNPSYLVASHRN